MNKKKIGIMTFHRALNFGAMLQAFALQQVLSERFDTEIVDYRCAAIENTYYPKKGWRAFIKYILRWAFRYSRTKHSYIKRKHFCDFSNQYLQKSSIIYTENKIFEANFLYDAFVAGSDQVWNPTLTAGDFNYFLEFASEGKKFSYAGSFGNLNRLIEYTDRERIQTLLNDIAMPLLREDEGFTVLEKLQVSSRDRAQKVCDPVFLLLKDTWIKKLQLSPARGKYVLVYFVAPQSNALEFARQLGDKFHLEIRYMDASARYEDCPTWCKNNMDAGPKQFLELLLGAEYIVTTSFHGMALSIILNKQFYYELSREVINSNSRLETISEMFKLSDREILEKEVPVDLTQIDYTEINDILQKYAERSKEILFHSLEGI